MVKTLGQRMRELRNQKNLSLRELARKVKVTPAYISDIELGRRHPSDEVLGRIARELGESLEDLKGLDTRPPIEDLRRLAASDPAYGFAFRRVIDSGVSAEDLINFAKGKGGRSNRSKKK